MNKILRWVKASERLPEKDGWYNTKVNGNPATSRFAKTSLVLLTSGKGGYFFNEGNFKIPIEMVEWLEETEPPYVNRLSEIVGKWPGDESAEEIIEGIKGEPQTNEGVIPYLKSEQEGQLIRMKALGIPIEAQTFEQCVNAVIFLAGGYKTAQTIEGVTEEMIENEVQARTLSTYQAINFRDGALWAAQFIEPLQKKVKELSYKAEAYGNVLSIFKIPEGQVIGYIKNFQDRLSSLQAENERLKKELESVKVAAKKVIDVYNGKNT